MNKYINKKTSKTFCTVMISGMLTTSSIFADIDINSSNDHLQAAPHCAESRDYVLNTDAAPSTYEPRKNVLTGTYSVSTMTEFEDVVTNFFIKLSSDQEPLGNEFERVLFDNLWDLYQS
ncbi:conserved exported hypothetical protein [Candidatus Magnetomoraceae bacterium gMMP-15]